MNGDPGCLPPPSPLFLSGLCCFHTCISVSFQRCFTPLYVLTTAALGTPYTKDELHWPATPTALVVLSAPAPRMERAFFLHFDQEKPEQTEAVQHTPGVTEQEAGTGALQEGVSMRGASPLLFLPGTDNERRPLWHCC